MDYLSLHISYPNTDDRRNAEAGGFPAGGDIMIHGLPNGWAYSETSITFGIGRMGVLP